MTTGLGEPSAVGGKTIRASAGWNAASLGGGQAIRITAALVLTAILGREQIGIVALANVYVALAIVFVQFGFGTLLIQKEILNDGHIGAATSLSLGTGVLVTGFTLAAAPVAADIFRTPELTNVLRVLSGLFLLKALAVVPTSLLYRQMRFGPPAIVGLIGTTIGAATGITLAIVTKSYWAIVWQLMITDVITVLGVFIVAPGLTIATSRRDVAEVWSFGTKLLGTNIVNFAGDNGDNALIGRIEGVAPLADYTLSYRILTLPVQTIGQTVLRSLLPILSRLQNNRAAVADLFYRAQRAVAVVATGPLIVLALAVGDAIPWIFGDEWASAVPTTRWIAVAGILRLTFGMEGATMTAMGRPGWQFWWSLATTAVSLVGFGIGIRWGIEGVAASIVITGVPLALLGVHILGRLIPVSPLGSLVRLAPVAATGLAVVAMWAVVAPPTAGLEILPRLVVRSSIASLGYVLLLATSATIRGEVRRLLPSRNRAT
jgi:O-antigen/teichoic acid export membrane protein